MSEFPSLSSVTDPDDLAAIDVCRRVRDACPRAWKALLGFRVSVRSGEALFLAPDEGTRAYAIGYEPLYRHAVRQVTGTALPFRMPVAQA